MMRSLLALICTLLIHEACGVSRSLVRTRDVWDEGKSINITVAKLADGQSLNLQCPRKIDNPGNAAITLGQVFYSANSTSCPDLQIGSSLTGSCDNQPSCTINAADTSTAAKCQKRSLYLAYSCKNPRNRAGVTAILWRGRWISLFDDDF